MMDVMIFRFQAGEFYFYALAHMYTLLMNYKHKNFIIGRFKFESTQMIICDRPGISARNFISSILSAVRCLPKFPKNNL